MPVIHNSFISLITLVIILTDAVQQTEPTHSNVKVVSIVHYHSRGQSAMYIPKLHPDSIVSIFQKVKQTCNQSIIQVQVAKDTWQVGNHGCTSQDKMHALGSLCFIYTKINNMSGIKAMYDSHLL